MQIVDLHLLLSHWCSVKDHIWNTDYRPVTPSEPTHDWEFRITDAKNGDMRHYIEKIVINLHETFAEPVKGKTKILTMNAGRHKRFLCSFERSSLRGKGKRLWKL